MRGDFPKPGRRCWSHFCGSYGLPEGLPERTPLICIGKQDNSYRFRDPDGREWALQFPQFGGTSFEYLDGEYCPESHTRFAEWMRHYLTPDAIAAGHATYTVIIERRWVLERNGFDPDTPPQGPCPVVTPDPFTKFPNPRLPLPPTHPVPRMRS